MAKKAAAPAPAPAPAPVERRNITVDVTEFRRTRDALTTAWITLSSSIDKAVKAYIEHSDMVMAGDATLNVSQLLKPFDALRDQVLAQATAPVAAATTQPSEVTAAPEEPAGKTKKKRKPRDPNQPKRPLTAYFRFLNHIRPVILAELKKESAGPHKPGDISILATQRWNDMSAEEHQPFKQAYLNEMVGWNEQNNEYLKNIGLESKELAVPDDEIEGAEEPAVAPADLAMSDSSTDSDTDSDDEPAPPPAPVLKHTKSSSPETTMKTPKSVKSKALQDGPRFSSINPSSGVPPPSVSSKKRKSEAAADAGATEVPPSAKKPRGRPAKEKDAEAAVKKEKKKKRASEV